MATNELFAFFNSYINNDFYQNEQILLDQRRDESLKLIQNVITDFVEEKIDFQSLQIQLDLLLSHYHSWYNDKVLIKDLNKFGANHITKKLATREDFRKVFDGLVTKKLATSEDFRKILAGLNANNLGERIEIFYQFLLTERERLRRIGIASSDIITPGNSAFIISHFAFWLDPQGEPIICNEWTRKGIHFLVTQNLIPGVTHLHLESDTVEIKTASEYTAVQQTIQQYLSQLLASDTLKIQSPLIQIPTSLKQVIHYPLLQIPTSNPKKPAKYTPYWYDFFFYWLQKELQKMPKYSKTQSSTSLPSDLISKTPIILANSSGDQNIQQEHLTSNETQIPFEHAIHYEIPPAEEPAPPEPFIPEETELLDYIKTYIADRGYYFDDETIYNYHICLKTRPFVILAGLSGTGKSKLSQLYAEAITNPDHYLRLPVRPNWNDDRYLLGYFNTLSNEYIPEPALEFILQSLTHPYALHFFCLDEMNLAHVEYYFAQFLSAMEEEQPYKRQITLLSKHLYTRLQSEHPYQQLPQTVYLPDNLLFTGTINVDETTQSLSDKVIDRANTIEFFTIDLTKLPAHAQPHEPADPMPISSQTWHSYRVQDLDTTYRDQIIEISKILNQADIGIGYRILKEIELYLANSHGLLNLEDAFDLQIKQRILPRIRGTELITDMLNNLSTYLTTHKLYRSQQRVEEMKKRLKRDGYTSFWR